MVYLTRRNKRNNKTKTIKRGGSFERHQGITDRLSNKIDNISASALSNVNEVLRSDYVQSNTEQLAKETAQITGKLAGKFNDAMNQPNIRMEIEKAIGHAGELADVAVDAFKEPFRKGLTNAATSMIETAPKFGKAVGKAVWDGITAIPPISIIGDAINIANDVSKATSAAVEAGSEAVQTASDVFIETKDNINKQLRELEEKKQLSQEISNRTNKSIQQFENPVQYYGGGGKKTRRNRKLYNKSRRVKFL